MLTNNPPFPQQLFRLNDYQSLSPRQPENTFSPALDLHSYSRGMGALGLPGDLSSGSRFVRAAFTRANAVSGNSEAESVSQFFHILGAVEQVRGCCEVEPGKHEITIYTSCCSAQRGIYYYTTYENPPHQRRGHAPLRSRRRGAHLLRPAHSGGCLLSELTQQNRLALPSVKKLPVPLHRELLALFSFSRPCLPRYRWLFCGSARRTNAW